MCTSMDRNCGVAEFFLDIQRWFQMKETAAFCAPRAGDKCALFNSSRHLCSHWESGMLRVADESSLPIETGQKIPL